eukprot:gene26500-26704_t
MTLSPAPQPADEPWVVAAKALRDDMRRGLVVEPEPPPSDEAESDRRGPLRPGRLTPLRNRIQGQLVGRLFRIVDVASLVSLALVGAHIATPQGWVNASLAQVTPYAAGAL